MENTLVRYRLEHLVQFQGLWKSPSCINSPLDSPAQFRLKCKRNARFSRISARYMLACGILLRVYGEAAQRLRRFYDSDSGPILSGLFLFLQDDSKRMR